MDLRTVVTLSALLFMTAESQHPTSDTVNRDTSFPSETNTTSRECTCPTAAPANIDATTSSPALVLGLLTIGWKTKCEGSVDLTLYNASGSSLPVCHDSKATVESLLRKVCENQKGCKDRAIWTKGTGPRREGYSITESGPKVIPSCETLAVRCTVEVLPDLQGQLQAYKVVTALLCCVFVILLLIRFTRPTVSALQKRLSDRRQNRWIGPTQSHSVSYHRGKSAVKSNDGEKRLSYPALERLAVSDSREPSSNRNSGFNF